MHLSDEHLSIDTPENVILDYQVAGIGSRFLAALADTVIITVLQALAYLAILFTVSALQGSVMDWAVDNITWMLAIAGLIAFAFLWGYYVFFEMLWNGQTPGKRWAKLRVIRTDGMPITAAESITRNLVRLVDFMPAYYGVGVLTMFLNDQARRLGDLAAGTLVVHDRAAVTLESLDNGRELSGILRTATRADPAQTSAWPVERLTAQDIQLAEDFIRRRYQLANRAAIAEPIAALLLKRMDISPDSVHLLTPENVITNTLERVQARADSTNDRI